MTYDGREISPNGIPMVKVHTDVSCALTVYETCDYKIKLAEQEDLQRKMSQSLREGPPELYASVRDLERAEEAEEQLVGEHEEEFDKFIAMIDDKDTINDFLAMEAEMEDFSWQLEQSRYNEIKEETELLEAGIQEAPVVRKKREAEAARASSKQTSRQGSISSQVEAVDEFELLDEPTMRLPTLLQTAPFEELGQWTKYRRKVFADLCQRHKVMPGVLATDPIMASEMHALDEGTVHTGDILFGDRATDNYEKTKDALARLAGAAASFRHIGASLEKASREAHKARAACQARLQTLDELEKSLTSITLDKLEKEARDSLETATGNEAKEERLYMEGMTDPSDTHESRRRLQRAKGALELYARLQDEDKSGVGENPDGEEEEAKVPVALKIPPQQLKWILKQGTKLNKEQAVAMAALKQAAKRMEAWEHAVIGTTMAQAQLGESVDAAEWIESTKVMNTIHSRKRTLMHEMEMHEREAIEYEEDIMKQGKIAECQETAIGALVLAKASEIGSEAEKMQNHSSAAIDVTLQVEAQVAKLTHICCMTKWHSRNKLKQELQKCIGKQDGSLKLKDELTPMLEVKEEEHRVDMAQQNNHANLKWTAALFGIKVVKKSEVSSVVEAVAQKGREAEAADLLEKPWDAFTMWPVLENMERDAQLEIEEAQQLLEGSIHQVHELYHARCNYGDKQGVTDHMKKQGYDKSNLHTLKWKEASGRTVEAEERLLEAQHGAHVEENQVTWEKLWQARGRLDMLRELTHKFKDNARASDESVMRGISKMKSEGAEEEKKLSRALEQDKSRAQFSHKMRERWAGLSGAELSIHDFGEDASTRATWRRSSPLSLMASGLLVEAEALAHKVVTCIREKIEYEEALRAIPAVEGALQMIQELPPQITVTLLERIRSKAEEEVKLSLAEIALHVEGAKTDLHNAYRLKQGALRAALHMKMQKFADRVQEDMDGMAGDLRRHEMHVEPLQAARVKLACGQQKVKVLEEMFGDGAQLPYTIGTSSAHQGCPVTAAVAALRKHLVHCIHTREGLEEVAQYVEIAQQDSVIALGGLTMAETIHDSTPQQGFREMALHSIYQVFDWDGNSTVSAEELYELGVARRHLNHRSQTWTEEANTKLVKRIDTNKDGKIDPVEFVAHFSAALPSGRNEFEEVIAEFMEVASHVADREKLKVGYHLTKPAK